MGMEELFGRKAIITGSSTGIGAATALVMARHGADIVVNCRQSLTQAQEVAAQIRALGREALVIQADVTQKEQVERLVRESVAAFGVIDILVNNVGHAYYKRIEDCQPEDWYQTLNENLTSQFYCLQAVLPLMQKRNYGRIVALSSISAQRGSPSGDFGYSASKGAILSLVKTLARQVASQGITINAVAPGIIDAGLTDGMSPERRQQSIATIPLGRLGKPEEVGELVAFLASDRAAYITGQMIAVNGGLYV